MWLYHRAAERVRRHWRSVWVLLCGSRGTPFLFKIKSRSSHQCLPEWTAPILIVQNGLQSGHFCKTNMQITAFKLNPRWFYEHSHCPKCYFLPYKKPLLKSRVRFVISGQAQLRQCVVCCPSNTWLCRPWRVWNFTGRTWIMSDVLRQKQRFHACVTARNDFL